MRCRWDGLNMADNVLSRTSSSRLSRRPYADALKPPCLMHFCSGATMTEPRHQQPGNKTHPAKKKMHRMRVPPFSANERRPKSHFHTRLSYLFFPRRTATERSFKVSKSLLLGKNNASLVNHVKNNS